MKLHAFALAILFSATQALACKSPIATSTMYFTPSALKMCGKWYYGKNQKVCPKFAAAAKMEGSGRYNPNEIYTYKREVIPLIGRPGKPDCPTALGRADKCLITYVSVAADPRYHRMGDIISMPALKGKKLTLPDGTVFIHPGYLRIDDVGGAIKGANRFDFYSGNMDEFDEKNSFGHNGPKDISMAASSQCTSRKTFRNVTSSSEKAKAKKAIEDSTRNISFNSILGIKANKPPVSNSTAPAPAKKVFKRGVGKSN